jgi:hypothetical protein
MLTRNFFISITHPGDKGSILNRHVDFGVQVVECDARVIGMTRFHVERAGVVAFVVLSNFGFEFERAEKMVHWNHELRSFRFAEHEEKFFGCLGSNEARLAPIQRRFQVPQLALVGCPEKLPLLLAGERGKCLLQGDWRGGFDRRRR